ncbi:hypothetical protein ACJDU8_22020 [Clostridium sp. WILCCON 0269]|uniref:Uncharacterized protein n=1 Tax=Candidatus Clostridium eludens TaxID=3381663 RepID=A0ABW8SQI1_9CLOT
MRFEGIWNICEMEMSDEEYFNTGVQAFIRINGDGKGEFRFGLVTGDFIGKIVAQDNSEKFAFKWLGTDELEPVNGIGWIKIINKDLVAGKFIFCNGEESKFKVRKID